MKKWLYKNLIFPFTKEGIELQRIQMIQQRCNHKEWICDTQIRVIECNNCGLRAFIKDYKPLFK